MDGSVGQDQHDRVLLGIPEAVNVVQELVKNRSEKGRSAHSNPIDRILVCFDDVWHASDVWVLRITIHWEAMTDLIYAHEARHTTEAKDWETTIVIVWLDNQADIPERLLVLIHVALTAKVQRAHLAWMTITCRVINCGNERYLPA